MRIAVEMSLYPLADDFIPSIHDFIDRLKTHAGLAVVTNSMSTQVSGGLDDVFDALRTEIAATFAGPRRSVFVMKVLGGGG
ncbi:MAG: YkoF family thiamine/hydroxymethylpyrimidine-binding protein [Steroidobacteraceae bacterium]